MDIRLIGTDADYTEALAEIERLWRAPPGSPEEAKLELFAIPLESLIDPAGRSKKTGGSRTGRRGRPARLRALAGASKATRGSRKSA
jgi:hypothetical protein